MGIHVDLNFRFTVNIFGFCLAFIVLLAFVILIMCSLNG